MVDELAQTLRRQYDGVVQEGIPDHLRSLVERIGRKEGDPTDGSPRPRRKKS
jgi:hypothetical protein